MTTSQRGSVGGVLPQEAQYHNPGSHGSIVSSLGARAYSLYSLLKLYKLLEIKLNFSKWSIFYLFHVFMCLQRFLKNLPIICIYNGNPLKKR